MKSTITIVSTMYWSGETLEEFHRRIVSATNAINCKIKSIVFVDDGSPDNSLEIALQIQKKDKRVEVLELSKNFGHHASIMAGLEYCSSDLVFLIDCDLEEHPEWICSFYETLVSDELDVVFGKQLVRRGSKFNQFFGSCYYSMFRLLTGINQPSNITTARIMKKEYVEALLMHKEWELSIGGIWIETGFKQKAIDIRKEDTSPTTYTFSKRFRF